MKEDSMGNSMESSHTETVAAKVRANAKPLVGLAKDFVKEPDPVRTLALDLFAAGLEHMGKARAIAEILVAAGYSQNKVHSDTDLKEARAVELDSFRSFIKDEAANPLHSRYTLRKLTDEATLRAEALRKDDSNEI